MTQTITILRSILAKTFKNLLTFTEKLSYLGRSVFREAWMKNSLGVFRILILVYVVVAIMGCSDGGNTTSSTSGSGSSSSSGGGGAGGAGGAGGSGTTGHPGSELTSAGDVVTSKKYKMVINFGGSTPAPGRAESSKHRLNSGLVGVTEN
jgi:hypothetical protein